MKTVLMHDNRVVEVIPDYATPVDYWYGTDFAQRCTEAPDEVDQGWTLTDQVWSPPQEEVIA